jgi:hypothetical protein
MHTCPGLAALLSACALVLSACNSAPVCEGFKGPNPQADVAAPPRPPATQDDPARR